MTTIETTFPETKTQQSRQIPPYSGNDLTLSAIMRQVLYVILGAFLLLRIWAMFVFPLTDTTEARYGEIARKMVETGNWITPQFDYGVPFWGKPPLHTWLSAIGMELFGNTEAAARFPILLVSLLVLAIIWLWVRDIVGRNMALLTVTILFSMGLFFGASAFVMTDMPMTLGTVLVMVGFWYAACRQESSGLWGLLVFVGLAIGLLAKGPVATVLCVIPLLLWLTVTRNWAILKRLPWLPGTALLALLVVPWYAAAEIATPGFLRYFIIGEHFERFVVSGWQGDLYGTAHIEPKGMIWKLWFIAAVPWSLMPVLFLLRGRETIQQFSQDYSNWLLYLLFWALAPLILFTPAANILAAYVLPGLPAAAILMTVLIANLGMERPKFRHKLKLGFAAAIGAIFLLFTAFPAIVSFTPKQVRLKSDKAAIQLAMQIAPDATIYTVPGRSFSAEFYSHGKAKPASVAEVSSILTSPEPAVFVTEESLVPEFSEFNLKNLGQTDWKVLLVKDGEGEK